MNSTVRRGTYAALFIALAIAFHSSVSAQTPISLYNNFTGKVDFTVIGGTLRSQSNAVNACSVTPSSSYTLTLPSGATMIAAYLYWAGSYSTANGSTQLTPDYSVTLDGTAQTATRTFTLNFVNGGTTYPFFSGFVDVTPYVASQPNNHSLRFPV
jgi:MSHA biogenesis protein MshQ